MAFPRTASANPDRICPDLVELVALRQVGPRRAARWYDRMHRRGDVTLSGAPAGRGRVVAARQLLPARSAGLQTGALVEWPEHAGRRPALQTGPRPTREMSRLPGRPLCAGGVLAARQLLPSRCSRNHFLLS
jgi:hypothetical protein